jgi:hypothetical protein
LEERARSRRMLIDSMSLGCSHPDFSGSPGRVGSGGKRVSGCRWPTRSPRFMGTRSICGLSGKDEG